MNLNWYPGHMVKALRRLEKDLPMVDAIIELADARIPLSSRNPDLRALRGDKPALLVLNRSDLAGADATSRWLRQTPHSLALNATKPGAAKLIFPALRSLLKEKLSRRDEKGQASRPLHLMVAGIPNIGKSTMINNLLGKKAARAEDRPGVTRGTQWFALENGWMLLDTPGLLWPKVEDEQAALHLAYTGAMPDDIMDMETLAARLACELGRRCPDALTARYKTEPDFAEEGFAWLEKAARKRAYLVSRGEADITRMSQTLLDEFRSGKIARISLEAPEENISITNTER